MEQEIEVRSNWQLLELLCKPDGRLCGVAFNAQAKAVDPAELIAIPAYGIPLIHHKSELLVQRGFLHADIKVAVRNAGSQAGALVETVQDRMVLKEI